MMNSVDGSGAPTRPRLLRWLIVLFGALVLVFGAGSASAALRHSAFTAEFGSDGTEFTNISDSRGLAYHQANKRIYVLSNTFPDVMHGLGIPAAEVFNPLGPPFPVETPVVSDSAIAVDNSGGSTDNYIYTAPDTGPNSRILQYDASGNFLQEIVTSGEKCGVAVDNEGFVWAGNFQGRVEKFNPTTGALVQEVDVTPPLSGGPCKIALDPSNNDLYVKQYSGALYKFYASSSYGTSQQIDPGGSTQDRFTVNAAKGVLYVAHTNRISEYDTSTGELLSEVRPEGCSTFRGVAANEETDTLYVWCSNGSRVKELPLSEVPLVTTGDPTGDVSVSGTVDPDGAGEVVECEFDLGFSAGNYALSEPCSPAPPYAAEQAVTGSFPILEAPEFKEETFHYRLRAANANPGGVNVGEDKTITPHWVPFLRTQDATEVTRLSAELHAAFDGNGEETKYYFEWGTSPGVYTSQSAAPPGESAGSPVGETPLSFPLAGLTAGTTYYYRIVAENGLGISHGDEKSFTTPPAVSNVVTDPATNVTTNSATLNGSFDIDALGGNTSYYFEYGLATSYGSKTAAPPGHPAGATPGSSLPVSKTIEVAEGTTYHYRLVVTNELGTTFGVDQEFSTAQPPDITASTSSNVTASTADLIAEINPNGFSTNYHFEYGTTPAYGQVVPIPDGDIGGGEEAVNVVQHLENLEVGATYHFRVVAENEWGEDATGDQTFAFFTANCPNAHLRQQTGAAYLPDCRAYELVSPEVAGPVQLFPGLGLGPIVDEFIPHPLPSNTGLASAPARFSFWGGIGQVTGTNPPNITQDLYLATRSVGGWKTHYPGLAASTSFASGGTRCSDALDKCVNYDVADPLELSVEDTGSKGPYIFDAEQNSVSIGRFPSMIEEVEGGEEFTGEGLPNTGDYTHFGFSSNDVAFAPGGLEAAPGSAYDNDAEANTAEIISKTPGGAPIAQDPEGCTAEVTKERQCTKEYLRIQDISRDGSHILISNFAPPTGPLPNIAFGPFALLDRFKHRDVHLTMAVNAAIFYDITQGHRAEVIGMTRDGSRVYFTSDEQVTPDDTDSSVDYFMWNEVGDTLTRLSAGSGGTGNEDECEAGWIPKETCNVQGADATIERPEENVTQSIYTPDNWIAENGDAYFYSPEQLDGGKGFVNARNLYVYRGGQARYVATFGAASPAIRMQVSPDGDHMAFLTSTQVTGYDNQGSDQMYLYDVVQDKMTCVSCVPTGDPPTSQTMASQNGLFMSNDGRTFFSTKDALVPFDTNGLRDVYEYVGDARS